MRIAAGSLILLMAMASGDARADSVSASDDATATSMTATGSTVGTAKESAEPRESDARSPMHTPDVQALEGMDTSLNPGEVTGLLGASGAGKSTTLRAEIVFLEPIYRGRPLQGKAGNMSRELAEQGIVLTDEGFPRNFAALRADLITRLSRKPNTMDHKAARMNIAIGRALINDPEIIVMDEPFAYEPSHVNDVNALMRAIEESRHGTPTLEGVYLPTDDLEDPDPTSSHARLDANTELTRDAREQGIEPHGSSNTGEPDSVIQDGEFAGKSLSFLEFELNGCQLNAKAQQMALDGLAMAYGEDRSGWDSSASTQYAETEARKAGIEAYCKRLEARIVELKGTSQAATD